ncbi:MAG: hypothetical protein AB7G21_14795 [Dehalococcoidia bacterium]
MRLGIDFDNTLADFVATLQQITRERTGFELRGLRERHPETEDVEAIIHAAVGKERFEALIHEVQSTDLTVEMAPLPGAVEVARRLALTHELVVVTARPEADTRSVRAWLRRHDIPVADLVATDFQPKAPHALAHGLSVHLDDTASMLVDFDEAHPTVPALIAHPMNARSARAAHWRSVEDWLAFERLVATLERRD